MFSVSLRLCCLVIAELSVCSVECHVDKDLSRKAFCDVHELSPYVLIINKSFMLNTGQ